MGFMMQAMLCKRIKNLALLGPFGSYALSILYKEILKLKMKLAISFRTYMCSVEY